MKRYRIILCLLISFIVILMTNSMVNSLKESRDPQNLALARKSGRTNEKLSLMTMSLPTIITDSLGDNIRGVDVIEVAGVSTSSELQMEIIFSPDTNITATQAGGSILLDLDQNANTGKSVDDIWFALPTQDVGSEYLLSVYLTYVEVREANTSTIVGTVMVTQTTNALSFSIPLSLLDNDEGQINFAAIVGDFDGPTDWAPEVGYGTIMASFSQYIPLIIKQ